MWKKMVGKNEKPVKIKPTTLHKIKATNTAAGTVLTFTATQIQAAMKFGFDLGTQAKNEVMGSDKGKAISKNKYFIHTMNVGKGAVHLIGGIYHGLEEAFVSVAKGTKEMTGSVLDYKYGKDVKQAFDDGTGVVGHVYEIKQAPKNAFHDEMYERTKTKHTQFSHLYQSKFMSPEEAKKLAAGNNQQFAVTNNARPGNTTNTGVNASAQRWKWN